MLIYSSSFLGRTLVKSRVVLELHITVDLLFFMELLSASTQFKNANYYLRNAEVKCVKTIKNENIFTAERKRESTTFKVYKHELASS